MTRRANRRIVFAASAALGIATPAEGAIVVDLRASYATGPATIVNPHLVRVTGSGAVINMDLIAQIVGSNANTTDDGFISCDFNVSSYEDYPPTQTLRGPMIAHRDALMMGPGSSNGMQTDLEGDGDLDVGGFRPVSNDAPLPIFGNWLVLGHASFTVDDYAGNGSLSLLADIMDWRGPRWMEDGELRDRENGLVWGTDWVVASAVAVPEPISLLLTSVATFASALRPRRTAVGRIN